MLTANSDDQQRFPLGLILMARQASLDLIPSDVDPALVRHAQGDWGQVTVDEWERNERALTEGDPVRSVHIDWVGTEFWIITSGDRQKTIVLLADEAQECLGESETGY